MSNKTLFDDIDIMKMQKQYMDALMAFMPAQSSASSNNPFNQSSPWIDAVDSWWNSVKPGLDYSKGNLYEKIVGQCRNYYFLSDQFSKLMEGMDQNKNSHDEFISFINDNFKQMESAFLENKQLFNWTSLVDSIEQPFEMAKSAFSNASLFSGDIMHDLSPEMKKMRDRFLTIPGLGYSRETQEKMQEAIRLWAVYQDNYQEYQTTMSGLNHEAMDLMRKKILKMHESGEEVTSMRQIYHLWVDVNEKVYGEYVLTKEYAEMNGRLVNSLMAFKKQSHEITEDILTTMNLPTSKSIKSLEKRQHDLRQQVRKLEQQIKELKSKPETKRKTKAVAKKKKKVTKNQIKKSSSNSNVVEINKSRKKKKKVTKKVNKAARKSGKSSDDKGMIKIKF